MLVLLILISSMVSTGIDDKAQLSKKVPDIPTYDVIPIYTEGVKRKLASPLLWNQLLFEDFESGVIPASWTVVDGNSDTHMWQIYSTSAWHTNAMPADSGQYIVGYDDNAAGSLTPTEEELILPVFPSMDYDSIALIYSFGYQNYAGYDTITVRVRTHDGVSWGGWNNLVLYRSDMGSGLWDTLSITPYLPADSFQIEFNWWDHQSGHLNWYVALDNIEILAYMGGGGMHDIGITSLNSPPEIMDINTPYPVISTFKNFGDSTMTFNAHAEITDTSGTPSYFNVNTTPIALLPDSSIQINFGTWTMTNLGEYRYMACTITPDSTSGNDTLDRILKADVNFSTNSLISPPTVCKMDTSYNVLVEFSNNGTVDTTADLYIDINLEGIPLFSAASMGVLIKADSTKVIGFGSFSFPNIGVFDYTANVFSPLDSDPANDTLTGTGEVSPWEIVTSMPENLMDHAVVFDGNDIFVLGGRPVSGSSKAVYKYSPGGIWTLCDSMPLDLYMFDACVLGDTIYVPGGQSQSSGAIIDTLFKYSISGDNWTSGPGTGEAVWFFSCEAANGKIYKMGGYDNISTLYSSTWEYDPSTGSWIKKTDMPLATELAVSWERNDSIYIAGGVDPSPMTYRNQTQIYDAVNDTWTMDSSFFAYLPDGGRWGAGGAIYRDTAFIMSGVRPGGITDSVFYYAFDGSNAWNTYPHVIDPVYRTDGVAAEGVADGFDGVYLFGGSTGGFNPISFVQARVTSSSSGIENHEKVKVDCLSIHRNISLNKINFSYNGNNAADITVRDVAGRVVREYTKVKPGSILNFGDGHSSGIYFISVKGTTECKKTVLIR